MYIAKKRILFINFQFIWKCECLVSPFSFTVFSLIKVVYWLNTGKDYITTTILIHHT